MPNCRSIDVSIRIIFRYPCKFNTVRIIICIFSFLLLNAPSFGQDYFEWISPQPTGEILRHSEDKLKIKVRVKPSHPADAKFDILVNGKSLYQNSKANTVPLIINNVISEEISITKDETKSIKIIMTTKGERYMSEPLFVVNGTPSPSRLILLSIGPNPPIIDYTEEDAIDFQKAFSKQHCGTLYDDFLQQRLIGEDAGYVKILESITKMSKAHDITPFDVFILFISSHGTIRDGELYIQPNDFKNTDIKDTEISMQQILDRLDLIDTRKLIFLDTCESGDTTYSNSDYFRGSNKIDQKTGYMIMAAGEKISYHHDDWKNGAFTEAILEGLRGKANENEDEYISINEIFNYIKNRVPELCKGVRTPTIQKPVMVLNELGDFRFFKYDRFCSPILSGEEDFYPARTFRNGEFKIGSPKGEKKRQKNEKQKKVTIKKDFEMGTYEITNQQYCEFLNDEDTPQAGIPNWIDLENIHCKIKGKNRNFSPKEGFENYPVVMVSWYGARRFAEWLSAKDCLYEYSLPTEQQWEYVARNGGNPPYEIYPCRNTHDLPDSKRIKAVGSYGDCRGIYDMSTNVAEWCDNKAPKGTKAIKGGSFEFPDEWCRIASKHELLPEIKKKDLGFRLIRIEQSDCD